MDLLEEEDVGVGCVIPEGNIIDGEGFRGKSKFEAETSSDFSVGLIKENSDTLSFEVLLISPIQSSLEVVFIFPPESTGLAFKLVQDVVCIDFEFGSQVFNMLLQKSTKHHQRLHRG
jgi:hypothetical protein